MFGITLADLKAFLGYAVDDTSRDVQLQLMLDAAFQQLKFLMGRNLERKQYLDTLEYHPQRLYLNEWPIEEVVSVSVGSMPMVTPDYRVFLATGYVHFKNIPREYVFTEGTRLEVLYNGGFTALPADLKLAVFNAILAADSANKQVSTSGGVVKRISVYDVGVTDFAVPRDGVVAALNSTITAELVGKYGAHKDIGVPYMHETEIIGDVPEPEPEP